MANQKKNSKPTEAEHYAPEHQQRCADAARRMAGKARRAGNKGNAGFWDRLAQAHEDIAKEARP